MRKDVRLGLAIGGSAIVVVACSVLFFRNPEPQPNPQAGQNPPATPAQPDNARSGQAGFTDHGAGIASPGAVGDPAADPVTVGPSDNHASGLPVAPDLGTSTGGTSVGGTSLGGTGATPIDATATAAGAGTAGMSNWQALLDNGDEGLIRTRIPTATEPIGIGGGLAESVGTGSTNIGGSPIDGNVLPPAAGPKTYSVVPGDTYWTIAQAEYGNGAYYTHIMRANPSVPANRLKAGLKIVIPDRTEVVPSGAAQPVAAAANLDSRTQYRVQKGDNLNTICKQLYGTTDKVSKLYQLNKELIGPNPNALKLGMVLQLPDPPAGTDTGGTEITPAFGVIQ